MDLTELKNNISDRHPWEMARLKVILDIFNRNSSNDNSRKTVLDIGCGDLFIATKFVKQHKIKHYIAVDSAFDAKTIGMYSQKSTNSGIKNISMCNDIAEVENLGIEKVDYVFLFDVIEHIENETAFMKQLLKFDFITEETTVFITVPAYNTLFTSHDSFLKHFRRYNNKMLRQLAASCDINIIDKGSFFSILLIPRVLKKLKEKITKNKNHDNHGIGNWTKKGIIDNLIVFVLYSDYTVSKLLMTLNIKLPGLSKYIVCKKSV